MARTPLSKRWAELWSVIAVPCFVYLFAAWMLVSAAFVVGFGLAILAGFLRPYGYDVPIMAAMDTFLYHPLVQQGAATGITISFFAVGFLIIFYVSTRVLQLLESASRRIRKLG